jgi:hypothetical protein
MPNIANISNNILTDSGVPTSSLQPTITLTTTGTSGASTLVGATLNIPQYQAAGTYVTSVTASAPLSSSGSTNPNITITQVSSTVDGYLSFSDYNVFSGKISGSGTAGYITRYTGSGSTIGNSGLYDDGTTVSLISRTLSGSSASFGSSVTATSFVKTGGTSAQFLKADGSVDSSTYLTTSSAASTYLTTSSAASTYLPLAGGTLTGGLIGTTATFTGKTLIGTNTATNHQLTVFSATEAAQVRVAGNAPSVVFTDTVTDPATYVAYFGMATATNNFISGSVAGDYIFHSYSGGNILFGISNSLKLKIASTGNVLIGTPTDAGYKLDVNGTGRFSGTITSSTGNNTRLFTSTSATTGYQYMDMNNTSGRLVWGINGSTANAIAGNSLANGGVIYALNSLQLGVDGDMKLTIASTGATTFSSTVTATSYNRSAAGTGFLNGKYAGAENTSTTGPIYCIGDSYTPTSTSTNTMYGIGYSYNQFTGYYGPTNTWGMYVVGGGTVGIFLAAGGAGYFASTVTATGFFESSDKRIKTLIEDNYQTKGIGEITPKLYTKNGKVELGYYAQDFVGVLDSAISKIDDGMLNLSYREVHTAKIYALEQRIKELESKLN